ncbi:uncharacterized protein LOC126326127 [Schistocerca gregaria]|uniref:uncharacterized protein LOC126326127 n=1 Tax=Schistocerca gregaria TaxID=7010 RepID=UPI00211F2348|nr:uncharacterized protein LOC126326127 [Schistocerca gregaria]
MTASSAEKTGRILPETDDEGASAAELEIKNVENASLYTIEDVKFLLKKNITYQIGRDLAANRTDAINLNHVSVHPKHAEISVELRESYDGHLISYVESGVYLSRSEKAKGVPLDLGITHKIRSGDYITFGQIKCLFIRSAPKSADTLKIEDHGPLPRLLVSFPERTVRPHPSGHPLSFDGPFSKSMSTPHSSICQLRTVNSDPTHNVKRCANPGSHTASKSSTPTCTQLLQDIHKIFNSKISDAPVCEGSTPKRRAFSSVLLDFSFSNSSRQSPFFDQDLLLCDEQDYSRSVIDERSVLSETVHSNSHDEDNQVNSSCSPIDIVLSAKWFLFPSKAVPALRLTLFSPPHNFSNKKYLPAMDVRVYRRQHRSSHPDNRSTHRRNKR